MSRLVLVGAGLANGLLALELLRSRPDVDITVLDAEATPGGSHTWSFHEGDLTPEGHALVAPLIAHRWPAQDVIFPGYSRRLHAAYLSIPSERFADELRHRLGDRLRLGARVVQSSPTSLTLEGGETLSADAVVWGGGIRASDAITIRFQTFVGHELRLARPHGLDAPVIMDATTPQEGGYRFTYLLPFTPDTVLVEDTAYEDSGRIDRPALERRIAAYCRGRGWERAELLRTEEGVLPITLGGDIERFWRESRGIPPVGLAGNFFHPVTGYSLPDAVRVAELVARQRDLSASALHAVLADHGKRLWREQRILRGLNRMLFLAGEPDKRWRVMQRFYSLRAPLIERFYAARLTPFDKARILVGKPPVPMLAAIKALLSDGRQGR